MALLDLGGVGVVHQGTVSLCPFYAFCRSWVGPSPCGARVACYRAAEHGRATEPADAVSARAGDARSRGARCERSAYLQRPPGLLIGSRLIVVGLVSGGVGQSNGKPKHRAGAGHRQYVNTIASIIPQPQTMSSENISIVQIIATVVQIAPPRRQAQGLQTPNRCPYHFKKRCGRVVAPKNWRHHPRQFTSPQ
jgi:hypothetical protein